MANINVKEALNNTISKVYSQSSPLPNPKINNQDETMLIDDLTNVFKEIPDDLRIYETLSRVENFELDRTSLNIKGILDKSLPFYEKYLQSNALHIILKSLSNKIIDIKCSR